MLLDFLLFKLVAWYSEEEFCELYIKFSYVGVGRERV